jgi:hypothetical protein
LKLWLASVRPAVFARNPGSQTPADFFNGLFGPSCVTEHQRRQEAFFRGIVMKQSCKRASLILVLGMLGLFLLSTDQGVGIQERLPVPAGEQEKNEVENLTRGPLHEAYAAPLIVEPRPTPIIPKKPPNPIEEIPAEERPAGENTMWMGGYFAWDDEAAEFIWVSGFWRVPPPGRQWFPGHWRDVEGGSQWVAGYWALQGQSEVEYLPPPPASLDVGPSVPPPNADSIYSPGCWVHQQQRFFWRPGFWGPAHTEWVYVPAHYEWTPAGCLFIDGYWDYPLHRRGLLFASLRMAPHHWNRPNWHYQPRYVVHDSFLLGALFVRSDFGRYYYGDYFAPGYGRHGFVPWTDYQMTRNTPGSLFGYYRWLHRNDRQWETNLRNQFAERRAGNAPRPPSTFEQQQQIIRDIRVNKTVQIGNKTVIVQDPQTLIQYMTVIGPLTSIDPKMVKLQAVSKAQLAEERKAIQSQQNLAHERRNNEAKILAQGSPPIHPTDPPRKVKVELPKSINPKIVKVEPPPPPPVPKHVEKPLPKNHEPVKPIRLDPKPFPHPEGKDKEKPPVKDKEKEKPPVKDKEKEKPPVKDKEKEKPPVKDKEKEKPPSKDKEKEKPPSKDKEKEKPPAKEKEKEKPLATEKEKSPPSDHEELFVETPAQVVSASDNRRERLWHGILAMRARQRLPSKLMHGDL